MTDDNTCPRCGGGIPNNERRGEYPGALSRTDNDTYVCSQCGQDEAIETMMDGAPMPQSKWHLSDLDGNPIPKIRVTVRTPKVNVIRDFDDALEGYEWMSLMLAEADVISVDVVPVTEEGE
jgi:DNA-directed RNA polymerase subunit RPC12/RpoP